MARVLIGFLQKYFSHNHLLKKRDEILLIAQ